MLRGEFLCPCYRLASTGGFLKPGAKVLLPIHAVWKMIESNANTSIMRKQA